MAAVALGNCCWGPRATHLPHWAKNPAARLTWSCWELKTCPHVTSMAWSSCPSVATVPPSLFR
eukprot:13384095-Alexandrium_andersonii.AAC.1